MEEDDLHLIVSNVHSDTHTAHIEQSVESPYPIVPEVQQQLAMGSIAIGTMACMTVLIREIRLLVQACKP
jgi:hypothetical protein